MPSRFFEDQGYEVAARRGVEMILWKRRAGHDDLAPPRFLEAAYEHHPVPGRVTIDLFWNRFCLTSEMEADRVRQVAAEFGDEVVLRDHAGEDRKALERYQIPRGIFIQGERIDWGYEAPREGIRDAIEEALRNIRLRL